MKRLFVIFMLLFFTQHLKAADKVELGWHNETGLGYVVTGGNSQSETTSFKEALQYQWKSDLLKFNGHYLQSKGLVSNPTATNPNNKTTQATAENWDAILRYEKIIKPKWFNTYVAYGWMGDRFQGVSNGYQADIGGVYYTANSETYKQFFELGYQYRRQLLVSKPAPGEEVGVGNAIYPEFHLLRLKAQIDYEHSKTFSMGAWIEYLPSVTDFDYQFINYSPYISSVLTDIFSLKVGYEGRYRSIPAVKGNKLTDYTFTTSLIAKF